MITAAIWNADVVDNLAYLVGTVEPELTNQSGGTLTAGAVVIADASNDSSFTTTTTADDPLVIGVVMESIANAAAGRVATAGIVTVNVQGNVARGDFLSTSTTAGRAKSAGGARNAGTFARALTAYAGGGAGTVTAVVLSKCSGEFFIESGCVFWFVGAAPTGYTEYTSARGRVIVGLPAAGTNTGTVGSALTDQLDQTHTHPYSQVDDHAHVLGPLYATPAGAQHLRQGDSTVAGSITTDSFGSASATSGAGSHMTPYIQLLVIEKS
jgi:hypothetical protein